MELNKAFGSAFVFSDSLVAPAVTPGVTPVVTPSVTPEITPAVIPVVRHDVTREFTHEGTHEVKRKSKSPEVYVLRVQICRDDCHLLCMFLLIFTVSFILSSRN